ncbi:Glutamate/aspartate import solute-binding protein [Burkholderiaceae bacterium]|nr:Glutamate/aspartate import solute-binding protein [Burkholderiaceae bacterium]
MRANKVAYRLVAAVLAALATFASAQESLTLRKVKETGVIALGYRDGSIPFSYLDDRQRPIGYSMDLCLHIVAAVKRRLGLEALQVKLTPVTSATRIPMVANHTIDLECGTTTNNAERRKQVDFTVTTFVASSRVATRRPGLPVRTLDDLRGKTVVSTAGTTSIALLVELNATRGLDMNILAGKDHVQSFRMLESKRADAFAMDDVLLYGLIASSKDPSAYTVSTDSLSVEPYGIALRKDDPEFKKLADDTLVELFRNGEVERIYRKWFESPIPPLQTNLRLPVSPALRKVLTSPTDSSDPEDYS